MSRVYVLIRLFFRVLSKGSILSCSAPFRNDREYGDHLAFFLPLASARMPVRSLGVSRVK